MDPNVSHVDELKISDLGESTLSTAPTTGLTYYGDQQSWAPEVRTRHLYSKASDIYSVGCIFAKMVKKMWDQTAMMTGENNYLAPKCMIDLIRWCTQPDPDRRPDIDSLTGGIEDIEMENASNIDKLLSEMIVVDPNSLLHPEQSDANADPEIPD